MANAVYNATKDAILSGSINFTSADIRAVLIDAADYTFSASHDFLDDIPGGARVGTPVALGGKTVGASTPGVFDADNVTFSAVSGDPCEAIVLFIHTGSDATARLLFYIDTGVTGLPTTPTGANIAIQWHASGIWNLDTGVSPESVWSTLSVMAVENPMDHGAVGNGTADDTTALNNTIAALPAGGGIVYLPPGTSFRKTAVINVSQDHLKFWAPNRQSEIFGDVGGTGDDLQAIFALATDGFGFFGVKLRSNATSRGGTGDDHMISMGSGTTLVEVCGCEIQGSRASGVFLFGSDGSYVEGNYVHHTYADHIHHTFGARNGWVWDNWIFNESPSDGDDGVACVTYGGEASTGALEFWRNVHLGSGSGRGYTVIGGDTVNIHHNWAIDVAGAGVLIATEPAYTSEPVTDVIVQENWITECAHTIGHPGILISALYGTNSIDNVDLIDNVSAANTGANYGAEGSYTNVSNTGLSEDAGDLPTKPTIGNVSIKDTTVLKTRDVSHVTAGSRPGLYRIHVRLNGATFQERFEYVVQGSPTDVTNWVNTRTAAGDYLSEQRTVSGTAYALLLCAAPVTLGTGVTAVTHAQLRAGDQIGANGLNWLWTRINTGYY